MIPNNVRTVRLTAAAGTNLARASSEDRSNKGMAPCISSPLTAVYNPKAFIPHAASLGQAFAHCRRFSTAATRRCLGSVSVPVRRVMLSHPLPIIALVGHYPTNKLIGHGPLPGQKRTTIYSADDAACTDHPVLPAVSNSYPGPRGTLPMHYSPLRRSTHHPKVTFALDLHA